MSQTDPPPRPARAHVTAPQLQGHRPRRHRRGRQEGPALPRAGRRARAGRVGALPAQRCGRWTRASPTARRPSARSWRSGGAPGADRSARSRSGFAARRRSRRAHRDHRRRHDRGAGRGAGRTSVFAARAGGRTGVSARRTRGVVPFEPSRAATAAGPKRSAPRPGGRAHPTRSAVAHGGAGASRQCLRGRVGHRREDRRQRTGQRRRPLHHSSNEALRSGTASSPTRTSARPAPSSRRRSSSGIAERERPGMPGGGTGAPMCALTASMTSPSHGLRSRGPQTASATRPPGRSTRRISPTARAGSRRT